MSATRKVLVVDDDPVVSKSIDRVLSGKGYAVISAANGEEALERLAREDYDVVYTDIRMPGMSGIEVARRIRETRPWLPVVIVTGYATEANEMEAIDMGAAGFLRKPLSPEVIEGSVERAMVAVHVESAETPLEAAREAAPAAGTGGGVLRFAKNVGLFIAAPFIGLAYVVVFPFVGLGLIAWTGYKALTERGKPQ